MVSLGHLDWSAMFYEELIEFRGLNLNGERLRM